ncbi:DUF1249 domain-containing protein [Halorhodospira abdelmalekii]|uniref:DUF1249 domain-containing protein n=1 Tax=Halorhodospira abdelmalekii TaxID=421629 RepID=UPI001F5B140A|nr:DUF1249 domain-containing protein [Halorhodospira abdelmalekii]
MLPRMIDTAVTTGALEVPPRSFAALMELYETNYIYMRRLAPGLASGAVAPVSFSRDGVQLGLEILDQGRYTTTVSLTHRFVVVSVPSAAEGGDGAANRNRGRLSRTASQRVAEVGTGTGGGAGDPGAEGERVPDLAVRVYHDARLAEVLEVGQGGARRASDDLVTRWAENRFLNRWLRFSLGEGHAFPEAVRVCTRSILGVDAEGRPD